MTSGDAPAHAAGARLQRERGEGLARVLRIGAVTAALTMAADAAVFVQTDNRAYLIFATLAALVLVAVATGFWCLRLGRLDAAVAVPLLYVLAIAPVGPLYVSSRALVSIALPFIGMAVAMNYASPRHLRLYGLVSWLSAATVLGLWQYNMVRDLRIDPIFAAVNVGTASLIVAFVLYALSHYSRRLQGSFDDVTAAHEELASAHGELREVDAARIRFMNTAAHELKTPLTPIRLQLEILKRTRDQGDARATRSIEILERNLVRLQRLVGDILDGARMDAGRLEIQAVQLDLAAVLREAVEEYGEAAALSGIRLEARIEPELFVVGDPTRMRQVIDNLVSNALKFTRPGGTVRLHAVPVEEDVFVQVSDDGIGIAPQDIARLFMPFRQVHDPMEHVTGGSGLGLYIARGIVERHGGRIWAESAGRGKGTTFSVCVPRSVVGAVDIDLGEPAGQSERAAGDDGERKAPGASPVMASSSPPA